MFAYLAKRLALAALLVLVVASGALVLARLAPGDYATESLGFGARPEAVAAARAAGFEGPLGERASRVFAEAHQAGLAAEDDAALFKHLGNLGNADSRGG